MKRLTVAILVGAIMMAMPIMRAQAQYRPPNPMVQVDQQNLTRDYAWLGYYKKHHNWPAMQAEQAAIDHELANLRRDSHRRPHYDYSEHHNFPPGYPPGYH